MKSIMCRISPAKTPKFYWVFFIKGQFYIISSTMCDYSNLRPSFKSFQQKFCTYRPMYAVCPTQLLFLTFRPPQYDVNEQILKISNMQISPLVCYILTRRCKYVSWHYSNCKTCYYFTIYNLYRPTISLLLRHSIRCRER